MIDEIPVLHCKLKKYERKSKKKSTDGKAQITRRYMIPIKKDQIEGSKFENVEDIVILTFKDFNKEIEKSKNLSSLINELEDSLKDRDDDIHLFKETEDELKKFEIELTNIKKEHESTLKELQFKNIEIIGVNNEYNAIIKENRSLKRELKRITELRELEKESLFVKANEIEINKDEYDRLKESHDLLWNVVHDKEKTIKNLEDKGFIRNLRKKLNGE